MTGSHRRASADAMSRTQAHLHTAPILVKTQARASQHDIACPQSAHARRWIGHVGYGDVVALRKPRRKKVGRARGPLMSPNGVAHCIRVKPGIAGDTRSALQ